MSRRYRLSVLVSAGLLIGCTGLGSEPSDTSPGAAKKVVCEKHCNRDYDVCSESLGARPSGSGAFFGLGAACDREVTACLDRCRIAAATPEHKPVDGKGDPKP